MIFEFEEQQIRKTDRACKEYIIGGISYGTFLFKIYRKSPRSRISFFVAMNAERCHLTGWVKNMSDGSVTAEVQGTRVEIEKFLNLIQTGNRFVRVDEIEKEERTYEENEKRFHVRY